MYICISDCVEIVFELLLPPNSTACEAFLHNWEQHKVLSGYLLLGHWPGSDWVNTWHWTKCFTNFFW
jgi:hypothetical protein